MSSFRLITIIYTRIFLGRYRGLIKYRTTNRLSAKSIKMSRQKKGVDSEGKLPAPKRAEDAADSTRDLFAVKKIFMKISSPVGGGGD